jgi:hypothetical protein
MYLLDMMVRYSLGQILEADLLTLTLAKTLQ